MTKKWARVMAPVTLAEIMSPAQKQGWLVLLRLAKVFPAGWCLVGGQMVWLLAAEYGADPPRATDDVDLVVDIRAEPAGIRDLCRWLEDNSFELEGISPDGIGHRYVKAAEPGPGRIMFDVLAPDNVGASGPRDNPRRPDDRSSRIEKSAEQLRARRSIGRGYYGTDTPPHARRGDRAESHGHHGSDPYGCESRFQRRGLPPVWSQIRSKQRAT